MTRETAMARRSAAVLAVFLFCFLTFSSAAYSTSEVCMTVLSYGYLCQDYKVTTEDGYVLSLQRIPKASSVTEHQPVLLQHGVLVDGMAWVLTPQGLALALSDKGFDVWIANSRGTRSSRGHTSLNADIDRKYWAWTWVELANFDLPANVDFIYGLTGQKVHYVGHSLGTLTMLASLSQHKLVDKVGAVALLAPIAHLKHVNSALLQLGSNFFGDKLLGLLGDAEFFPQSQTLDHFLKSLCSLGLDCRDMMSLLTGPNCCLNQRALRKFESYEPQSTSTRNIMHLAQMIRSGNVAMYDYGNIFSNDQKYGRFMPPVYDISSIPADVPLFLSYGGRDALSDVQDVNLLVAELRNHQMTKLTVQSIANYAHGDFVMAFNAGERLHAPLIKFLANSA